MTSGVVSCSEYSTGARWRGQSAFGRVMERSLELFVRQAGPARSHTDFGGLSSVGHGEQLGLGRACAQDALVPAGRDRSRHAVGRRQARGVSSALVIARLSLVDAGARGR